MKEDKLDLILHELQSVNTKLDKMDERLGIVEQEVGSLKQEVGGLKQEVGSIKDRLDSLEQKVDVVYEQAALNTEKIIEVQELHKQQDLTLTILSRRSLEQEAKLQYQSII